MNELWTGMLLALRIVLPGEVWLPLRTDGAGGYRISDLPGRIGRAVTLGLLLNLLPALAWAQAGGWTPARDWMTWGLLLGLGIWKQTGWRTARIRAKALAGEWLAVALTVSAVLAMPTRSEWLAGGWDPGIYQNNALAISARNGLAPAQQTIYADMAEAEREWFTRSVGSYHEVMPGVPIRLRDGALPLFFFHLTPLCGAWCQRLGGLELLNRMPVVLALLGLWPACALFGLLGLRGWQQGLGALLWVLSPLWWYQQAIPTSEMLYLGLLCGGTLFYLQAAAERKALPVAAGLCLFAATVNHFNFPVVGGVLLLVAAGAEAFARAPRRLPRVGFCLAALGLGVAWDLVFAQTTVHKLQEKDHVLWWVLGPFALTAGLALLAAWRPLPGQWPVRFGRATRAAIALGAAGALGLILALSVPITRGLCFRVAGDWALVGGTLERFYRLMMFHGAAGFVLAAAGMIGAARDRAPARAALRATVLGFGLVLGLFLVNGGIAPIYPWALRRYVVVAVPFIALTQAYGVIRFVESWRGLSSAWRVAGCMLVGLAMAGGVKHSVAAFRVGDYRGLSGLIETLDAALAPGDVVVADDPRWGTPLLLARGRDIVNGKLLWSSRDADVQAGYLRVLERIRREGDRRVLWLTSTDSALHLYPLELGRMQPVFEGLSFTYRTVVHGAGVNSFMTKADTRTFNLFLWRGASPVESTDP